jgi:hypothetical protein
MTASRLIHYSRRPLLHVRSVEQSRRADRGVKPDGLWFSVGDGEDGWRSWCASEMPHWLDGALATEVVLASDATMLRLVGATEIDAFTAVYGILPHYANGRTDLFTHEDAIDWRRVAEKYQGIIIAPYVWERRHELRWYYGWDCSSGVVWDAKAVAELRLMTKADTA